jgi:AraC-like DNA-binding protein
VIDCLQLTIPPLPQFLTGGFSVWKAGDQHFERSFDVYDLILVRSGALHMSENDVKYRIGAGEMLLLEPGLRHVGHRPCEGNTEIYWIHFKHSKPRSKLPDKEIVWSTRVGEGTDRDLVPQEQHLYLPKHGAYDRQRIEPIVEEILQLRSGLVMALALDMQVLLAKLLSQLQASLRQERVSSRSLIVAEQVMGYLELKKRESFAASQMAEELHFNEDYAARCLRKHTGLSPLQYHHMVRSEEAKQLLRHTQLSLQEIAEAMGYGHYNYFSRMFRKSTGLTPGAYRRSGRGYV